MNTSEHYGLNLAEGSDIFNPLVTDVPNFEIIDSALYAIDQKAIGTATELVSGSVHALTRQGGGDVFKFVATGNAKAGDTYTVDGQQVTALLPSGETLADGAYVINATVVCALNGTVLTFYLGSGSVEEAEDSKKLGGQLPSYYGTAADTQSAIDTATAAQSIAINARDSINVRYNSQTDRIEVFYAGSWRPSIAAGVQWDGYLLNNGVSGSVAGEWSGTTIPSGASFSTTSNAIKMSRNVTIATTVMSHANAVDLSAYDYVSIDGLYDYTGGTAGAKLKLVASATSNSDTSGTLLGEWSDVSYTTGVSTSITGTISLASVKALGPVYLKFILSGPASGNQYDTATVKSVRVIAG